MKRGGYWGEGLPASFEIIFFFKQHLDSNGLLGNLLFFFFSFFISVFVFVFCLLCCTGSDAVIQSYTRLCCRCKWTKKLGS